MGAACMHMMSPSERDIPKAQWDTMRFGYGCISQDDYGALNGELEKLCETTKLCTPAITIGMRAFDGKVQGILKRIERNKNGSGEK